MSIWWLILELRQFSFIRDLPEIRKSEMPKILKCLPNIWKLGQVWDTKFGTNVTNKIKYYWMLQNARVTAFTVSKLLRENQQGEGVKITPPPDTHTPWVGLSWRWRPPSLLRKKKSHLRCFRMNLMEFSTPTVL